MNKNIYKSEEGRNAVESLYRGILEGYALHPYKQLFVPTDIAQTHVLNFGDGKKPPLILIHGSVSNSATWLGNISDFINDFCVYCVDIPGEPGLSEPIRCTLASDEPYRWLSSLLDNLGIKKASFLTMSLGSWYALDFAVKSPERVTALSMITTGGIVPAKASFVFKAVLFMLFGKPGAKLLDKAIYYKTAVPPEVHEFQAVASKNFAPVVEPLPVFSDEELSRLAFPIQFFGGDHDALVDSVKTAQRLKALLPHAEVHVLEDTGHVIIDRFGEAAEFLKKGLA